MNTQICAAVVTYHPNADFERLVRLLRPQVGHLVVVDNRSPDTTVGSLRILAETLDFALIENPDNYGIGAGLNQSIEWATRKTDCEFILFFDQDSLPSETFVNEMVSEYRRHDEKEQVFLVTPRIVQRNTGETYPHGVYRGKYLVAQTSGSLMPIRVFAREGVYREDLFIDYVDYEFCLRVAARGWKIVYCDSALLWHDPGNVKQFNFLGIRKVTTSNYSPLRRYYLMRNGIWTIKKYCALFPEWAAAHAWQMLKGSARVLIFEQHRTRTILMWMCAIRDVLLCKFGRYPRTMNA